MAGKPYRIAIVGSCDPAREGELKLRNMPRAAEAGEAIGHALAKRGYHLIVYSSDPHYFEVDVVRGYAKVVEAEPDCIEVRYSASADSVPAFAEQKDGDPRFRPNPDSNENWEYAFYQSIPEVDGMILLGGGHSTLVAGIVTLGHKKPIVACAAFGGAARDVWHALGNQGNPNVKEDIAQMATEGWSLAFGEKMVAILARQFEKLQLEQEKQVEAEQLRIAQLVASRKSENRLVNDHVIVSLFSLALGIFTFIYTVAMPDIGGRWWSVLMLISAVFTGVTGAATSVVYDKVIAGKNRLLQPVYITILLGAVAGFAAAVLFILAQAFANPSAQGTAAQPVQYDRLILYTSIVGLVAGLTFENVFTRLRSIDVVRADPISGPQGQKGTSKQ